MNPRLQRKERWRGVASAGALLLALTGCDDSQDSKKPADAAATASAEEPKSKLTEAIQSAADSQDDKAPQAGQAPPPNGVFGPGLADQAHAADAPPKVTVIQSGDGAKVTLGALLPGEPQRIEVAVSKRNQGQQPPARLYTVELGPVGEGGPTAKAKGAPEPAAEAASPADALQIVVRSVALEGGQKLPPELEAIAARLVGKKIVARLSPAGTLSGFDVAGLDQDEDAAGVAAALMETLDLLFSPLPAEPVGKGASWIASDRTRIDGIDVVRYRVTTVQELQGDQVALAIDVRHYATGSDTRPFGAPPDFRMVAFESFGKASYTRKAGSLLPASGEVRVPVAAQLGDPQGRTGLLNTELVARLKVAE